ncbi:hypothetical protein PSU4_19030 [Pseudonocardia sulfidoxydans NBRC 16205]|uniref:DUF3566 domain-containing protein n=1 Tax=Pseudonocardia sulfidoxydans NBRC 16205 TaxID=1223511 RepID=A0A511DDS4_9PSEU|nr:DUF3566 domain-containing protein [Pseudonocardia sulfidoxydans]GEL22949.1 hypothetical protein PSU4_19030 [Pseudonocardia sulfidoxydans NBRC 16205]
MSENSKQADESGRVATGDAAAPGTGSDAAPSADTAGNGTGAGSPATGSPSPTASTAPPTAPPTASTASAPGGNGAEPSAAGGSADAPTEIRPAVQNGNGSVDVTKPAAAATPAAGTNSAAGTDSAAAQSVPGNGKPSPTARPVPTPRPAEDTAHPTSPATTTAAPADDQGVPAPGPHAETPPPWQRMPGSEPVATAQPTVAEPPVAGGLFDGPTAYIDPAGAPTAEHQGPGAPAMSAAPRRPRQAALQLKRLDPWSVLKLALVLAVVIFFIWMVAVGVLYGVLDGMGVWDRLNGTYNDLVSGETQTGSALISAGRVFGIAAVIGAINSLLFAVAMTIGAFVYNVSADLVGGVEVTLSERD